MPAVAWKAFGTPIAAMTPLGWCRRHHATGPTARHPGEPERGDGKVRIGPAARARRPRLAVADQALDRFVGTAIGMLDHSAGIAVACGAAPVVIHPTASCS